MDLGIDFEHWCFACGRLNPSGLQLDFDVSADRASARYKGLGEMNAEQLWDTTLNPATRTLRMVTLEDAEQADLVFDELMGNEVEGRKKWIMANAKKAELDL